MLKSNLSKFFDDEYNNQDSADNILVIDGHNLVYRCINIAVLKSNEYDGNDELIFRYWKHLVLNSFFLLIKKFNPDRVIFAIDSSYNWRKNVYPDYKAQRKLERKKSAIDFDKFFVVLETFLSELKSVFTNIHFLKVDNAEGDDIIATIAKELKTSKITIVSNDGDFVQLMDNPNVSIWNPQKKKITKCINPKMALELKIIMGDSSDNIPAIKPRKNSRFMTVGPAQKMINDGIDKYLKDEDVKKNYIRNKKLIDLNNIPSDIKKNIIEQYSNYEISELNGRKVWEFLTKNRLMKQAEDLQINIPFIKQLN